MSFDPFIEKYEVVSESGTVVTVTRGYGMEDAELVRPGGDGSYELREVDIDELFDEYKAMGRKFTAKSKYKDYTLGSRLSDEEFADAMRRLSEARTREELHEIADEILDRWPPNDNGRDRSQWDEMSRLAKELDGRFEERNNVDENMALNRIQTIASHINSSKFDGNIEYAALFDKDGNIVGEIVSGSRNRVYVSKPSGYQWADLYISHTHTGEIGGTLSSYHYDDNEKRSTGDICTLVKTGARGIDATCEEGVYSLDRTENADPLGLLVESYAAEESFREQTIGPAVDEFYNRHGRRPDSIEDTNEVGEYHRRLMSDMLHMWYDNNASKYGFIYRFEPR